MGWQVSRGQLFASAMLYDWSWSMFATNRETFRVLFGRSAEPPLTAVWATGGFGAIGLDTVGELTLSARPCNQNEEAHEQESLDH
jgi:hypothetical protein